MDNLYSIKMRASSNRAHISGAEGIYGREKIQEATVRYIDRAIEHSRGEADEIHIIVRALEKQPLFISALPITTVQISSVKEAKEMIETFLITAGISHKSIRKALSIVYGKETIRGAALISAGKAERLDPNIERGIRATGMGISDEAYRSLSHALSGYGMDKSTVREAVILASKVASCEEILAELCVSDDPYYTTGYIAVKQVGYIRIPHIKNAGNANGGRVFFVREDADIDDVIDYLEKKPVMVEKISNISGEVSKDEFFSSINR